MKVAHSADTAGDNPEAARPPQVGGAGHLAGFCMGPKGRREPRLARLWGIGRRLTRRAAARRAERPGQLALEDLFETYRFRSDLPSTRLLGVLGSPVGHSLSPHIHNAALPAALDLDYC